MFYMILLLICFSKHNTCPGAVTKANGCCSARGSGTAMRDENSFSSNTSGSSEWQSGFSISNKSPCSWVPYRQKPRQWTCLWNLSPLARRLFIFCVSCAGVPWRGKTNHTVASALQPNTTAIICCKGSVSTREVEFQMQTSESWIWVKSQVSLNESVQYVLAHGYPEHFCLLSINFKLNKIKGKKKK